MGREEVTPPVAHEHPAPGGTIQERKHHGITDLPSQAWCNVCVKTRGREKTDMKHDHQSNQAHGSSTRP